MSHPEFIDAIQQAKTLFITAHVGPDGDTLGSMLALKHGFQKHFKHLERVDGVIAGQVPKIYDFLPGTDQVKDVETATDLLPHYDVSISVDCGSADRLGASERLFREATISVNIDHHISNKRFGSLNIVEPTASASGEVVADLFEEMGIPLDANIAPCLYTAIVTDTGGFKYSNTTPKILRLAANLVEAGADPELTFKRVYEERPLTQVKLHTDALQHAQFNRDHTLAWTTITRDLLQTHGAIDEQIEGVVESLRQIDTVLIAAVFKETPQGTTKVSLRSDSHEINVATVVEHFNGGGHKMAAGCTIEHPPEEARKQLLPLLEESIRQKEALASRH